MLSSPNLADIIQVAQRLGPLRPQVVLLGGAATGLLLTDPAAPEVRHTDDIDVIVEVASLIEYYRLEETLRGLGFQQRHEPADPICRWTIAGIIVDVMPTEESILGFGNRWYALAIRHAENIRVAPSLTLRMITAPYFLATKLEAFQNRGAGDFLGSRDIADIVSVIDGRPELVLEVAASEETLRQFLSETFLRYLPRDDFREAVAGNLLPDPLSQQRISWLLHQIQQMIRG